MVVFACDFEQRADHAMNPLMYKDQVNTGFMMVKSRVAEETFRRVLR